jgi:hypothetical protein
MTKKNKKVCNESLKDEAIFTTELQTDKINEFESFSYYSDFCFFELCSNSQKRDEFIDGYCNSCVNEYQFKSTSLFSTFFPSWDVKALISSEFRGEDRKTGKKDDSLINNMKFREKNKENIGEDSISACSSCLFMLLLSFIKDRDYFTRYKVLNCIMSLVGIASNKYVLIEAYFCFLISLIICFCREVSINSVLTLDLSISSGNSSSVSSFVFPSSITPGCFFQNLMLFFINHSMLILSVIHDVLSSGFAPHSVISLPSDYFCHFVSTSSFSYELLKKQQYTSQSSQNQVQIRCHHTASEIGLALRILHAFLSANVFKSHLDIIHSLTVKQ